MAAFSFSPNSITVKAGTTVTWVNNDDAEHTVTDADAADADSRLFDSSGGDPSHLLKKGDKFTYTFTTPGTYHFKCLNHPFMTGTVVVQ